MTDADEAAAWMREHPHRHAMVDELHARPFVPMPAPARVVHLAFGYDVSLDAMTRSDLERAHIAELFARWRAEAPAQLSSPDPLVHLIADLGGCRVKWERHSEFASYLFIFDQADGARFDDDVGAMLGRDWLRAAPGALTSATHVVIERVAESAFEEAQLIDRVDPGFVPESLCLAWIADRMAVAAADFRLDAQSFSRISLMASERLGPNRVGRLAQRLIELDTYRAMAMLALPVSRDVGRRLGDIDSRLFDLVTSAAAEPSVEHRADGGAHDRRTLEVLTATAADVERLTAESAYRFSAAHAYEAIVDERLALLRMERVGSSQTFQEFTTRRFKPAMRTCHSTERRLQALAARAERAANLLRTRVDVQLASQNQSILRSMDDRAQLQLRLQQTVEGLSVVAISYYAVNLVGYLAGPLGAWLGLSSGGLKALIAAPVIGAVWWTVRSIKKSFGH